MLETWPQESRVRLLVDTATLETWLRESGVHRLSSFCDKLS